MSSNPGTDDTAPIGRDAELAALTNRLDALTSAAEGGVVWLSGEPGVGASTVLGEFRRRAAQTPCTLRATTAIDGPDLAPLRDLVPEAGTDDMADPTSVIVATVGMLCARAPMVLVLEDLHHTDDATLLTWSTLTRSAMRLPLLMVSTCHSRPYQQRLAQSREALRTRGARFIDLAPLTAPDIVAVAARRLGDRPGPQLTRILRATGGNPGRMLNLLTALDEADQLTPAGHRTELTTTVAVSDPLLERTVIGDLPAPVARLVRCASLAGARFDVAELAALTGDPVPAIAAALSVAVEQGVLRADGNRLAFEHDVVRAAAARTFSGAERIAAHRTAAESLLAAEADPAVIARHLLHAGPLPEAAVRWLADMPEATLLTAPETFARLLGSVDGTAHGQLVLRRATLEYWLGRAETAADTARTAATEAAPEVAVELIRLAARADLRAGHAAQVAARHADAADPRLSAWAAVALTAVRPEPARGVRIGAHLDGDDALTAALAAHAMVCSGTTITVATLARLRDALPDDIECRELRALLHADILDLLVQTGPAPTLATAIDETPAVAGQTDPVTAAAVRATAERAAYLSGQWTALAHASPGIAGLLAIRRLRAAPAGRRARPAPMGGSDDDSDWWLCESEAIVAEQAGRLTDAAAGWAAVHARGLSARPARLHGAPHLVRLAIDIGDRPAAESVAVESARIAAASGLAAHVGLAALTDAALTDDAPALLRAAELLRDCGAVLSAAVATEEAAVRFAAAGDRSAAGLALREATRAYAAVGAAWDVARADARLRSHGVRRRVPADRPATGWAALSPAEFRVLRLVARGLSNRDIAGQLFLSPNTVQTHVARIRQKLGLRSRVEIARAAGAAHGPL